MNQQDTKKTIDLAIKNFKGQLPTLEAAIGTWLVGEKLGWKPLYLVHDKTTLAKYEKILGIKFREVLQPVGPWAHKSVAWNLAQKVTNFWKAVKGEIPDIRTPDITK